MWSLLMRLFAKPADVKAPRDIIKTEHITQLDGSVTINLGVPSYVSSVLDTNSMVPTVDWSHNTLLIKDFNREDLECGDVVVFQPTERASELIIHRIVETGIDNQGAYYRTKGDNCTRKDPYILRNIHVRFLCIGVIY